MIGGLGAAGEAPAPPSRPASLSRLSRGRAAWWAPSGAYLSRRSAPSHARKAAQPRWPFHAEVSICRYALTLGARITVTSLPTTNRRVVFLRADMGYYA
eukprot:6209556-Pleurochrysis_carterae.AAC.7